ncbi:MAG: hypothetical protein KDK64_01940 [Chlamydiia bacterium]|nr:hypothetical protein [Chlamydiia bacterium]
MSTVTNSTSEANQAPTTSNGVDAIFMAEAAIAEVLGIAISAQGEQATASQENAEALLHSDAISTQNLQDEIEKQEHHGFWHHFLNIGIDVVMGAVIISSLATGDVAGAVLMAGLMTAQLTGGFGKAAGEISKGLQAAGVPPEIANITADVVVILIAFAAGAGLSALGAADAGIESSEEGMNALEEGIEMTDFSSEVVVEDEVGSGAEEAAKKENPSNLKKAVGSGLLAGSAATGQVSMNLTQSIMALSNTSGNEEKLIGFLVELALLVASIGGGMAGASMAFSTTAENDVAKGVRAGLQMVQGSLMAGEGVVSAQMGVTTERMGKTSADLTRINAETMRNNEMLKKNSQRTSEIIATYESLERQFTDLFTADYAAARA